MSELTAEEAIKLSMSNSFYDKAVANPNQEEVVVSVDETTPTETEPAVVPIIEPTVEPITIPVTPAADIETQKDPFDPIAWFKENGLEDIDSIDTLKSKLNQPAPEPIYKEPEFANEASKRIYEALQAGDTRPLHDYLNEQAFVTSIKEKSPEEIVKAGWIKKFDLSPAQADRRFNKEFGVDELLEDEDKEIEEKFVAKRVQEEAENFKQYFSQLEQSIQLPSLQAPVPASTQQPELTEEAKKAISYSLELNKSLPSDFSYIPVQLKDDSRNIDFKASIPIPQSELANIKTQLGGNEDKFLAARWFSEDGSPKDDLIARDIYVLTNIEKILQSASVEASQRTWEAKMKTDKNYHVPGATVVKGDFEPSEDETKRAAWRAFYNPSAKQG